MHPELSDKSRRLRTELREYFARIIDDDDRRAWSIRPRVDRSSTRSTGRWAPTAGSAWDGPRSTADVVRT